MWLASYPKSGNTWVRALLAAYSAENTELDINNLGDGPIASSSEVFEDLLGVSVADLTADEIERYRPAVYRLRAAGLSAPSFIKAHDAFTLIDGWEPLFPANITAGIVYIVRNPLGVVPSLAAHAGIDIDRAIDRICDESFVMAKSNGAGADQLPQRLRSWSGHVRSWVDESDGRILIVRYEDLHADTVDALHNIICFSGLRPDSLRLRRAVGAAAFGRLKARESEVGFRERAPRSSAPFFRRGAVDSWRDELTDQQVSRIIDAHRPMMRRFGYLPQRGIEYVHEFT